MRKAILGLMLFILCHLSFGQNKEDAEKLVFEGIGYHDKGDYEGAISKYNSALELDNDNINALAEKALSLNSLQKYDESIQVCQKALKTHPGEKELRAVYVTCGNAYDALKKTDQSIETYDAGIREFPDYYQLHFNKGITLSSIKKYEEAILSWQKSATLNPNHAGSQNALARMLNITNKRIPSLLAYSRFLVIEPQGNRAKENLLSLQKIMKGNTEETGKKSVTINLSSDMLADANNDGKPKENNFASTDLVLSMAAGLDYEKENKKKTEVENFIRKFESVCGVLQETKKDNYGFYWDFYVPYFSDMKENKLIETFAYIAFASSDDSSVSKWLASHKNEIDRFYNWSKSFAWDTK